MFKQLQQDINQKVRTLELVNQTAFMVLGEDLFLLDCHEGTMDELVEILNKEKVKKIHIFICSKRKSEIQEVAAVITTCRTLQLCNISLYYPECNICEELRLQGVPDEWYNHNVNLWDEIMVEGYVRSLEYMFYEEEPQIPMYGIELEMQENFLLYYSPWSPSDVIARGTLYDEVYCRIHSEGEYESLCMNQKQNPELYQRFHIISSIQEVSEERVTIDHFSVVERVNKEC